MDTLPEDQRQNSMLPADRDPSFLHGAGCRRPGTTSKGAPGRSALATASVLVSRAIASRRRGAARISETNGPGRGRSVVVSSLRSIVTTNKVETVLHFADQLDVGDVIDADILFTANGFLPKFTLAFR